MKQALLSIFILLHTLIFCIFGVSCGGVCYDLADKICACETTNEATEACKKKLDVYKSHQQLKLAENTKVCEAALKTCSCPKLAEKQYDQCGLTPDPEPVS